MISYEIKCPVCKKPVDSHDSYSDTRADLREHIAREHPQSGQDVMLVVTPVLVEYAKPHKVTSEAWDDKKLDEIDRNARAYGFEIGRGKPLSVSVDTSSDNPFLEPNWRDRLAIEEGDNNNGE